MKARTRALNNWASCNLKCMRRDTCRAATKGGTLEPRLVAYTVDGMHSTKCRDFLARPKAD